MSVISKTMLVFLCMLTLGIFLSLFYSLEKIPHTSQIQAQMIKIQLAIHGYFSTNKKLPKSLKDIKLPINDIFLKDWESKIEYSANADTITLIVADKEIKIKMTFEIQHPQEDKIYIWENNKWVRKN